MRIREATSFSLEEAHLYLTKAVEWMWIDADLSLFGLNLLILVTTEIVFRLLGLVYYFQLLYLAVKWL